MRCVANILNLVVKNGLKGLDLLIISVRAIVRFVRFFLARPKKFKACVEEENIGSKCLGYLDIETR